ncbi:hypothetical protein AAHE18_05G191700 [Arachis hypogaea]
MLPGLSTPASTWAEVSFRIAIALTAVSSVPRNRTAKILKPSKLRYDVGLGTTGAKPLTMEGGKEKDEENWKRDEAYGNQAKERESCDNHSSEDNSKTRWI